MNLNTLNLFLAEVATPATEISAGPLGNLSPLEQVLFVVILIVLLGGGWAVMDLSFQFMRLEKARLLEKYSPEQLESVGLEDLVVTEPWWQTLYTRLTDTVPVEKEADIMLDHNYDGVQELDNNLPPWWKGLFYASIIFAPIYIYYVHYSDYGMSSQEEYVMEMEAAAADVKAYLATQEDAVDETNVTLLVEASDLSGGQTLYIGKCAVCHGQAGEGGIGPNLTDEYWLHGGSIADVFGTIKNGVPEKGMIAWKNDLRAKDMQKIASYIMGMKGTNPANPKEVQGELYVETEAVEEPGS